MAVMRVHWCHFVVHTAAKEDVFVEIISIDQHYWENVLLPALTTFYTQYVFPEILLHHLLETRVLSMNPSVCSPFSATPFSATSIGLMVRVAPCMWQ